MRYIVQCDDPSDMILGMNAIKALIRDKYSVCYYEFDNNQLWFVRQTKTGYSARLIN